MGNRPLKPLAIFVHGAGLDGSMWLGQVAALSDTRECVTIEYQPGRLELVQLIQNLGHQQADLVGHSWGGHEVLAAWWRTPSAVRTIALFGVMFSRDAPPHQPPANCSAHRRPVPPVPPDAQEGVVRSISVPLLVATGADDAVTPSALCRRLAQVNPGARWLEISDAGHLSPLEQPDHANAALRALW